MFESADLHGEHKMTIIQVSESNLNLVRNNSACVNAIQISFMDRAVIWDLDSNFEIKTLLDIQDFIDVETFTRTGFKYHTDCDDPNSVKMEDINIIASNDDGTLFSNKHVQNNYSACFRLFTALDLFQFT